MALKGRYRLIIKQGPVPGKVFEIAKQVITLGRDVKSDFVVNDAEVSRSHTRLTVQSDGCLAEDLGSTNGTYINGQRITGAKMIRPGDVLGLGETVLIDFVFVPDAEATLIAPPLDIPSEPVTPAMPFPARPAPGRRVVLPTAQSSDALQNVPAPSQPQRDSRMLWAAGAGCGVLLLIACLALVVAAIVIALNLRSGAAQTPMEDTLLVASIVIALNPNILQSLGGR